MKKPQFAAALLTGLLTAALVLGCGAGPDTPNTPKEPEPQKPKITLNYETVKLEQGKELSLAKLTNADKITITKSFHRTGAMTKIGSRKPLR